MKINILGQDYEYITDKGEKENKDLIGRNGLTDFSTNEIFIDNKCQKWNRKYTIRHEIFHALLNEAGYIDLSRNEEFVSMLAMKFPHLLKLFKDLKAL